jgi:integrase
MMRGTTSRRCASRAARTSPRALADCVPSMRRWKLASLPTFLPAAQVQKALDGCDRATPMRRRDYAILMMLAKLGLRADEVATLTLDDIDWHASEMLVRAKGRQRARMPIPPDVGAAIVAYLRSGRPKSSWSAIVHPRARAACRLCFWVRDHDDRQDRS